MSSPYDQSGVGGARELIRAHILTCATTMPANWCNFIDTRRGGSRVLGVNGGCDTIRALSAAAADRPWRDGRGLPGLRHQNRPHRRAKAPAAAHGGRRDVSAT